MSFSIVLQNGGDVVFCPGCPVKTKQAGGNSFPDIVFIADHDVRLVLLGRGPG